ncbi:MAG: hypothetical protein JSV24_11195 [Bacteroidales bacterium]|nr:MAG: hypothetical protein JSV24_11195 [Bacteroidales bacterium]
MLPVSLSDVYLYSIGNPDNLPEKEMILKSHFERLAQSRDDAEKVAINKKIIDLFKEVLEEENSFKYPFDSLVNIGNITSGDKKVRIYTWNIAFTDGTHRYCGFVQHYLKSEKKYKIYFLSDESDLDNSLNEIPVTGNNWYGALYYQIIPVRSGKSIFYTVLGVDMNNIFTRKRIIDIIYFTDEGIRFGFPLFTDGNLVRHRVIFEYSARLTMNLKYDKSSKMIVFDHLSPSNPEHTGQYAFYGPDASVDGFKFRNNRWLYVADIDYSDRK